MNTSHRALSDFDIHYPHPVALKAGDRVSLGIRDKSWPEWIWVESESGTNVWIHESMLASPLARIGECSEVTEDYDSREISVQKDEKVDSLRLLGGWHWCKKENGSQGWIPDYVLEQIG